MSDTAVIEGEAGAGQGTGTNALSGLDHLVYACSDPGNAIRLHRHDALDVLQHSDLWGDRADRKRQIDRVRQSWRAIWRWNPGRAGQGGNVLRDAGGKRGGWQGRNPCAFLPFREDHRRAIEPRILVAE
jgi:hypothetical protein